MLSIDSARVARAGTVITVRRRHQQRERSLRLLDCAFLTRVRMLQMQQKVIS